MPPPEDSAFFRLGQIPIAHLGDGDGVAGSRVLFLERIDTLGDLAEDGLRLAAQRDLRCHGTKTYITRPGPRRRRGWTPCGHRATNDEGRLAAARRDPLIFLGETGAGEGIRTLDPNLGKVVLYP